MALVMEDCGRVECGAVPMACSLQAPRGARGRRPSSPQTSLGLLEALARARFKLVNDQGRQGTAEEHRQRDVGGTQHRPLATCRQRADSRRVRRLCAAEMMQMDCRVPPASLAATSARNIVGAGKHGLLSRSICRAVGWVSSKAGHPFA